MDKNNEYSILNNFNIAGVNVDLWKRITLRSSCSLRLDVGLSDPPTVNHLGQFKELHVSHGPHKQAGMTAAWCKQGHWGVLVLTRDLPHQTMAVMSLGAGSPFQKACTAVGPRTRHRSSHSMLLMMYDKWMYICILCLGHLADDFIQNDWQ